jgi:ubiquinone/menaquinone biosynthesis C-methylase UbiE
MDKSHLSVGEGYKRWAPTYDRDPNPLLALEERQLELMIGSVEDERVLDLACGTGRWLTSLTAAGASIGVGLDFSPAMLAVAQEKCTGRACVVQADCRAIPFADRFFDVVICSFAMAHIPDLGSMAFEVGRVASPEADVYVSDLHPLAFGQGWHTGFRDSEGSVEIISFPRSVEEISAIWKRTGFECARSLDCRFGEAERPIFERAGKAKLFEIFRHIPAVLLCHFTRGAR